MGRSYDNNFSHDDRVRLSYVNHLSNVWLEGQKYLCPVYKDDRSMVFCMPSMTEIRATGKMLYNEEEPVFIHIGKLPDEQCAVVCSKCHPQMGGFWPKFRFEGTSMEEPCLGFQKRTFATEQLKPLCTHTWALFSIPKRKGFSVPVNPTNLWKVAEALHGPSEE